MPKNDTPTCPVCQSQKFTKLISLDCGNLDNSSLYETAKVVACEACGHIYNFLSRSDIVNLKKYYREEYVPLNLSSTDKIGDRPGSKNRNTIIRFNQIYKLFSKFIKKDNKILDVGCAKGGFLDYLQAKGFKKLYGIDLVKNYVDSARKEGRHTVKFGDAEKIPFRDNFFDLLVIDQVLEHLAKPARAFREASRVLVDGGLFCVGLPDALRYNKEFFFDFYWFIMREHIQHFDLIHLKLLAESEGFELVSSGASENPMVSDKMVLPNLSVVFRKINKSGKLNITKECFNLKREMAYYIKNDSAKLNKKIKIINKLIASQKPLYAWGIGREFLFLYESGDLKKTNLIRLVDTNLYKQKHFRVNNHKILPAMTLKKASPDSTLIITAIAHSEQIRKSVSKIGYQGEIIEF